ncbi:hypothetical protein [Magnetospira sp. QH-2]|uniref:hypothetical protein n=1 Tax=Magnetospira sp. (strain QH-2) TaxID=1288970 RepID=UPI0005FA8672|nr:hypothetical protein [Magnetospira sp. QH-2]
MTRIREQFTLLQIPRRPKYKTLWDRIFLTIEIWPYFYFNYATKARQEEDIAELVKIVDTQNFKNYLLIILDIHYIASILSLGILEIWTDKTYRSHFEHMHRGAWAVMDAQAETPKELIDRALNELMYDDVTYHWSRSAMLGSQQTFCSVKPFLSAIRKRL